MKHLPTARDTATTARDGEAAPADDAYPEPLARFVRRVESMRKSKEGEALAYGVAEDLGMLLQDPNWLLPEQREGWPDRFHQHILHVAPDGDFSVVAVVWQPGQSTLIHDHVSWCVVGVYEGKEEEYRYHLYRGAGEQFLVEARTETAGAGEVTTLIPPEEDIHKVTNAGTRKAISIHVYGAGIGRLGSSINHIFDDLVVLPAPETPTGFAGDERWPKQQRNLSPNRKRPVTKTTSFKSGSPAVTILGQVGSDRGRGAACGRDQNRPGRIRGATPAERSGSPARPMASFHPTTCRCS